MPTGIDAMINDRAEVMATNPQAMQEGTHIPQDLLDALATQKALKDKEAAKRSLALSTQTNPNSIVAQNEQKLMNMNKSELAARTAGILATRQQQVQQQQMTPQAPMQGGGGIASFAKGGEVSKDKKELLAILGMSAAEFNNLSSKNQETLLANARETRRQNQTGQADLHKIRIRHR